MTEAEWLGAEDSLHLIRFLEERCPSERKMHLFVCAYCRHLNRDAPPSSGVWAAVSVAERFADHLASKSDLREAKERLLACHASGRGPTDWWPAKVAVGAHPIIRWGERVTTKTERHVWAAKFMRGPCNFYDQLNPAHVRAQANLLRDLFAPFAFVLVLSPWLTWNDGTAVRIAETIYHEGRFSDLPVLADAIEDAGCADDAILSHLRSPGPHVRGCWALDLILGKH